MPIIYYIYYIIYILDSELWEGRAASPRSGRGRYVEGTTQPVEQQVERSQGRRVESRLVQSSKASGIESGSSRVDSIRVASSQSSPVRNQNRPGLWVAVASRQGTPDALRACCQARTGQDRAGQDRTGRKRREHIVFACIERQPPGVE